MKMAHRAWSMGIGAPGLEQLSKSKSNSVEHTFLAAKQLLLLDLDAMWTKQS
jgi:hypothetical protein